MTTVKQFNRVWEDFTIKSVTACGLTKEAKAEIAPLFAAFAEKFERRFQISIQKSDTLPPETEITGAMLEKLKAWVERISRTAGEDYLGWCGFRTMSDDFPFP